MIRLTAKINNNLIMRLGCYEAMNQDLHSYRLLKLGIRMRKGFVTSEKYNSLKIDTSHLQPIMQY